MGKLSFFWNIGLRIICRAQAGREYWRGHVWGWKSGRSSEVSSEAQKARRQSGHSENPPKSARYALGIDHEGARFKSHPCGMLSAQFFRLEG